MAIIRARNPLRWIRRALLAVGVLSLSLFGVLLAAYQFGSAGRGVAADAPLTAANVDERTVTAGQGFDYTHTSEGRPVFRIRADRSRQDREDWAYLEEVQLEIYRQDGDVSTVTSRRARVHQRTRDAELEGDVVLRGWADLELEARALEIRDGARVLTSVGAVQFDYPPDLKGRATSLRIDRRTDTIQLSGGVHIRSADGAETPLRMDCDRMVYRRGEGLIRAFDDVYLKIGEQELETRALSLFLRDPSGGLQAPDPTASSPGSAGHRIRRIRARWDVRGRLSDGGETLDGLPGQRADFQGQFLDLQPNPDDPSLRRVRLEGRNGVPASIKVVDASGLARRLTGRSLESHLIDGVLQLVEGVGSPLLVDEFLDLEEPYLLRQACARQARARFLPGGDLGSIELRQQVELRDLELYLSGGSSAVLDFDRGHLDIEGPAVELYNDRGIITAPRFTYARDKGIIHAHSGVRALLRSTSALDGTPLGSGGPIWIESREATWTEEPPTFAFRHSVRAWRGQDLLMADQLRGDERLREMAASGHVKTIWLPAGQRESAELDPKVSREPIEVTADQLSYRPTDPPAADRRSPAAAETQKPALVYSGQVEVRQMGRILRCRELSLELAEEARGAAGGRQAQRMVCKDDVYLLDALGQREVRGDTAIYTVDERQVEVFGENVRLSDESENVLTGKYLLYDLDADSVVLKSSRPAVAGPAGR